MLILYSNQILLAVAENKICRDPLIKAMIAMILFGFYYRAKLKRNPFNLVTYSDCYNNIKQNDSMGKDSRYSVTARKFNKFEVSLDYSCSHLSKCAPCKILNNYVTAETYAYPYNTKIHHRNIQLNFRLSRSLTSLSYNTRRLCLLGNYKE